MTFESEGEGTGRFPVPGEMDEDAFPLGRTMLPAIDSGIDENNSEMAFRPDTSPQASIPCRIP